MNAHSSIRIPCRSNADATDLALRLQADGYRAARRWKAVIARAETNADAARLALALGVDYETGDAAGWDKGPATGTT